MIFLNKQNQSKSWLSWKPFRSHSFILTVCVVTLSSCAPPTPVATSQPTSNAVFAIPTLGIISTQVSTRDGMVLVLVPADIFQMGGAFDNVSSFPVHTVYLDDFWIDQTEVTNEMFATFVDSTGHVTDAEKAGGSNDFRTENKTVYWEKVKGLTWDHPDGENSSISGIQDHPVVHVTWNDANAYCTWAGRRLPTEAEWEKAASWNYISGEKYEYPWGNDFNEKLANFCDESCSYDFAIPYFNDGYAETSPVGSFPQGASPYGALDMSGNVWEWVADWYAGDYYESSPASNPLGPDSGQERVVRGGAWATNHSFLPASRRDSGNPSFPHRALGFRCALGTSP
jgi:eukaryotic-like serine/threonine-protein kinase